MNIFLKIPAWHDREEQVIPQPHFQELPRLNENDLFKVDGRLWQWHHIEYDCDNAQPSATIVLHTHAEKTKEEEVAKHGLTYRIEKVELPDGTVYINVPTRN